MEIRAIWKEVLTRLIEDGAIKGNLTMAAVETLAVEYECRVNPVWPMPGARELLDALQQRGMVLGVVSNAQFFTPLLFEAFFRTPLSQLGFEPALCQWSFEALEAKPSDRLFRNTLDALHARHGMDPAQVLYVGNDWLNDILPAARLLHELLLVPVEPDGEFAGRAGLVALEDLAVLAVKLFHELFPDDRAFHLTIPALNQTLFNPADDLLEGVDTDRSFLTGFLQTRKNFLAIKWLSTTILFHDQR